MSIPTGRPHHLLIELRLAAGMSPNDLAARSGLSGKTVRLAEKGFIPGPRAQFALAGVFDRGPLDLWPYDRGRQRVAAA